MTRNWQAPPDWKQEELLFGDNSYARRFTKKISFTEQNEPQQRHPGGARHALPPIQPSSIPAGRDRRTRGSPPPKWDISVASRASVDGVKSALAVLGPPITGYNHIKSGWVPTRPDGPLDRPSSTAGERTKPAPFGFASNAQLPPAARALYAHFRQDGAQVQAQLDQQDQQLQSAVAQDDARLQALAQRAQQRHDARIPLQHLTDYLSGLLDSQKAAWGAPAQPSGMAGRHGGGSADGGDMEVAKVVRLAMEHSIALARKEQKVASPLAKPLSQVSPNCERRSMAVRMKHVNDRSPRAAMRLQFHGQRADDDADSANSCSDGEQHDGSQQHAQQLQRTSAPPGGPPNGSSNDTSPGPHQHMAVNPGCEQPPAHEMGEAFTPAASLTAALQAAAARRQHSMASEQGSAQQPGPPSASSASQGSHHHIGETPLRTASSIHSAAVTQGSVTGAVGIGPLIRSLVVSSGNGCESVLALENAPTAVRRKDSWTTRSFRKNMESSCTLELKRRLQSDVTVKVTFVDGPSTPNLVRFSHATAASKAFEPIGEVQLQGGSKAQLQHVFRLGTHATVHRYLRITFVGHLLEPNSGAHRVQKLAVIGTTVVATSGLADDASTRHLAAQPTAPAAGAVQHHAGTQQHPYGRASLVAPAGAAAGQPGFVGGAASPASVIHNPVWSPGSLSAGLTPHTATTGQVQIAGIGQAHATTDVLQPLPRLQNSVLGQAPPPYTGLQLIAQQDWRWGAHADISNGQVSNPTMPATGSMSPWVAFSQTGQQVGPNCAVPAGELMPQGSQTAQPLPHPLWQAGTAAPTPAGMPAAGAKQPQPHPQQQPPWDQAAALASPAGYAFTPGAQWGFSPGPFALSNPFSQVTAFAPAGNAATPLQPEQGSVTAPPPPESAGQQAGRPPEGPANAGAASTARTAGKAAPGKRAKAPPPPPPPPPKGAAGAVTPPPVPSRAPPPPPPLPPGGKGAPPPPPPPPGGKLAAGGPRPAPPPPPGRGPPGRAPPTAAAAPVLEVPTPSKPMMKLFWQKLPQYQVKDTVWNQLAPVKLDVDFKSLEDAFAAKDVPKVKPGSKKGSGATMLLTMQRSNNVGVFLSRLKMTPAQIKQAILCASGNAPEGTRLLTDEEIVGLLQCLPTPDEAKMLQKHSVEAASLGSVEQFMLEVMGIPLLDMRLNAARFETQFGPRLTVVQDGVDTLMAACDEVRTNKLLPTVLKIALAVGNFLNAGNRNGAAAGFQIETLLKLKEVRSTSTRSKTLLHFMARELCKHHPAFSLKSGLQACTAAAKLNLDTLKAEMADMRQNVRRIEQAIATLNSADDQAFKHAMEAFHTAAGRQLQDVEGKQAAALAAFKSLAAFLNGSPDSPLSSSPQQFFQLLNTFAQDLDAAQAENMANDSKAEKKAQRAQHDKTPTTRRMRSSMTTEGPLRKRDKVLVHIRAFARLKPEDRPALLTEKGARDRVRKLGLKQRVSVPAFSLRRGRWQAADNDIENDPVDKSWQPHEQQQQAAMLSPFGPNFGASRAAVRASCPISPAANQGMLTGRIPFGARQAEAASPGHSPTKPSAAAGFAAFGAENAATPLQAAADQAAAGQALPARPQAPQCVNSSTPKKSRRLLKGRSSGRALRSSMPSLSPKAAVTASAEAAIEQAMRSSWMGNYPAAAAASGATSEGAASHVPSQSAAQSATQYFSAGSVTANGPTAATLAGLAEVTSPMTRSDSTGAAAGSLASSLTGSQHESRAAPSSVQGGQNPTSPSSSPVRASFAAFTLRTHPDVGRTLSPVAESLGSEAGTPSTALKDEDSEETLGALRRSLPAWQTQSPTSTPLVTLASRRQAAVDRHSKLAQTSRAFNFSSEALLGCGQEVVLRSSMPDLEHADPLRSSPPIASRQTELRSSFPAALSSGGSLRASLADVPASGNLRHRYAQQERADQHQGAFHSITDSLQHQDLLGQDQQDHHDQVNIGSAIPSECPSPTSTTNPCITPFEDEPGVHSRSGLDALQLSEQLSQQLHLGGLRPSLEHLSGSRDHRPTTSISAAALHSSQPVGPSGLRSPRQTADDVRASQQLQAGDFRPLGRAADAIRASQELSLHMDADSPVGRAVDAVQLSQRLSQQLQRNMHLPAGQEGQGAAINANAQQQPPLSSDKRRSLAAAFGSAGSGAHDGQPAVAQGRSKRRALDRLLGRSFAFGSSSTASQARPRQPLSRTVEITSSGWGAADCSSLAAAMPFSELLAARTAGAAVMHSSSDRPGAAGHSNRSEEAGASAYAGFQSGFPTASGSRSGMGPLGSALKRSSVIFGAQGASLLPKQAQHSAASVSLPQHSSLPDGITPLPPIQDTTPANLPAAPEPISFASPTSSFATGLTLPDPDAYAFTPGVFGATTAKKRPFGAPSSVMHPLFDPTPAPDAHDLKPKQLDASFAAPAFSFGPSSGVHSSTLASGASQRVTAAGNKSAAAPAEAPAFHFGAASCKQPTAVSAPSAGAPALNFSAASARESGPNVPGVAPTSASTAASTSVAAMPARAAGSFDALVANELQSMRASLRTSMNANRLRAPQRYATYPGAGGGRPVAPMPTTSPLPSTDPGAGAEQSRAPMSASSALPSSILEPGMRQAGRAQEEVWQAGLSNGGSATPAGHAHVRRSATADPNEASRGLAAPAASAAEKAPRPSTPREHTPADNFGPLRASVEGIVSPNTAAQLRQSLELPVSRAHPEGSSARYDRSVMAKPARPAEALPAARPDAANDPLSPDMVTLLQHLPSPEPVGRPNDTTSRAAVDQVSSRRAQRVAHPAGRQEQRSSLDEAFAAAGGISLRNSREEVRRAEPSRGGPAAGDTCTFRCPANRGTIDSPPGTPDFTPRLPAEPDVAAASISSPAQRAPNADDADARMRSRLPLASHPIAMEASDPGSDQGRVSASDSDGSDHGGATPLAIGQGANDHRMRRSLETRVESVDAEWFHASQSQGAPTANTQPSGGAQPPPAPLSHLPGFSGTLLIRQQTQHNQRGTAPNAASASQDAAADLIQFTPAPGQLVAMQKSQQAGNVAPKLATPTLQAGASDGLMMFTPMPGAQTAKQGRYAADQADPQERAATLRASLESLQCNTGSYQRTSPSRPVAVPEGPMGLAVRKSMQGLPDTPGSQTGDTPGGLQKQRRAKKFSGLARKIFGKGPKSGKADEPATPGTKAAQKGYSGWGASSSVRGFR